MLTLKTLTTHGRPSPGQIQDLDSDWLLLFLEAGVHTILRNILPFIEYYSELDSHIRYC